jgi:hypothetical protein
MTIYTSTCCRPDYVQLLACALSKTVTEPYRFVVVVHPGGLRRDWHGVDAVIDGTTDGYAAWREILPMMDGPSVILHDDCVPVLPWSSASFPGPNVIRTAGYTLQYRSDASRTPDRVLHASRVYNCDSCPDAWTQELCEAAAAARAESLLGGTFLHIDKGTIAHPDSPISASKPPLVAAIAAHLGCEIPAPLTAEELNAQPGRPMPRAGLGDMVSAGLSAVGVTKERAQRVANAVGIKDCGCTERQARLNALGRRLGIG